MARNSVCKTAILFVFGGLVYFGLEVLFRGHSHWTMFVLGGFLFLILGELNEGLLEWDTPLIWQGVLGSAIVTGAELVTGMILNVWLGLLRYAVQLQRADLPPVQHFVDFRVYRGRCPR